MTRYTLILLLPFALACGGDDSSGVSTAGDVSQIDSPSINRTGADCLVGSWEMDVEASYNLDAVNAMIAQEGDVEVTMEFGGSEGTGMMTLGRDGSAVYTMDDLAITINADTPMGAMVTTNTMNGTANGTYSAENNVISFEGGTDNNITTNTDVMMGGRQMSNSSSSDHSSPFDASDTTTMTFECTGDVLLIDVSDSAVSDVPVFEDMRFTRQ